MNQTPWGIDWLKLEQEELNRISPEAREAIEKECALFNQCFSTAAGRKVLTILAEKLDAQTWSPDRGPNYGYYNEGQDDVLRYILNRVNYRRDK